MQIKTTYDTTITNQLGLNNATIKMTGADQIFRIRDDSTQNEQYNVQLTEVNLDGCAKDCGIAQGGLIYNQETLVLSYVTLKMDMRIWVVQFITHKHQLQINPVDQSPLSIV